MRGMRDITPLMRAICRLLDAQDDGTLWPYEIQRRLSGRDGSPDPHGRRLSSGTLHNSLESLFDGGYVTRSPESVIDWIDRTHEGRNGGRERRRTLYTVTWAGKRLGCGDISDNAEGDLALCGASLKGVGVTELCGRVILFYDGQWMHDDLEIYESEEHWHDVVVKIGVTADVEV